MIATLNKTRVTSTRIRAISRACDRASAQSQQANVQNREDEHLGDGQYADAQEVEQEDPGQEEAEARQSVGFILRLK